MLSMFSGKHQQEVFLQLGSSVIGMSGSREHCNGASFSLYAVPSTSSLLL